MEKEILLTTEKSKLWKINNFTTDLYSELHKEILSLLEFEPKIILFGKEANQRRNVGFFSDESIGYKYSNQIMKSQSLSDKPILIMLLKKINIELGTSFNGILVNHYIDGTKNVGAHGDDENGLDKNNKMVAAISYGAIRKFRIKDAITNKIILDIPTYSCSLIIMEGEFQKEFKHEIPIEKKVKKDRISLTFRYHIS